MKSTSRILRSLEKEPLKHQTWVKTGFPKFDETIGLHPGQLIVLAGRPGMGIQAFLRCLLLNTSIQHNIPIGIFLLEETAEKYVKRMIATEAGTSFTEMNRDVRSDKTAQKLQQAKKVLAKAPILMDDELEFSLGAITAKIIAQSGSLNHTKLFVIQGYRLLTHGETSAISRQQELDLISRELKTLAENVDVTLIITHELPEITSYTSHKDVQPTLNELYEDTPLAKYADLALFLYRPEYYKFKTWYDTSESCECEAELEVAKNRHGNTHSFRLFFDGYRSRFNEVDDERFKKQPFVGRV